MSTRKVTGKKLLKLKKKKPFYGVKEFKRDLEKQHGPITFGRLLESHRKCEELTQEELGKMIGISRANICDLEKGRVIPSVKRAADIAEALGLVKSVWIEYALQDQLRQHGFNFKVSIAA